MTLSPDTDKLVRPKTALLSVAETTDLKILAHGLQKHGVTLMATDGTFSHLAEAGFEGVIHTSGVTGIAKTSHGRRRSKTLHPHIHDAIQLHRDHDDDMAFALENKIRLIDMVVTNLRDGPLHDHTELDVGGLALLDSAIRNCRWVVPVAAPEQYNWLLRELDRRQGHTSHEFRLKYAIDCDDKIIAYRHDKKPRLPRVMATA